MSKDLQREYRALIDSEAPDLWDRIEAGLEDRTVSDTNTSDQAAPDLRRKDSLKAGLRGKRFLIKSGILWQKKGLAKKSLVGAGLVAACVCAAFVLPVMIRTMRLGGGYDNTASNSTTQDNSAPSANETAYENGGDNAAGEGGVCFDKAETIDGIYAGAEFNANTDNNTYNFMVTVEILDLDIRADSGILYTAKVSASENPDIQADNEIKIFGQTVSENAAPLEKSKVYDLVLREDQEKDSSGERIYFLVKDADE